MIFNPSEWNGCRNHAHAHIHSNPFKRLHIYLTLFPSYGAMMWSLGKVVQTPEVMRVYLGSFWLEKPPNCFEDSRELLDAEQKDLLKDLRELPRNAAIRKINEIVKRARLAKVGFDDIRDNA